MDLFTRTMRIMEEPAERRGRVSQVSLLHRFLVFGTVMTAVLCLIVTSPSEAGTHKSFRVTYNYSCCSWKLVHTIYRPGNRISIHWSPVFDSSPANVRLRLTAWIVGPYSTVDYLKHNSQSPRPGSGVVKIASTAITLSNSAPLHPVSVIRLPRGIEPGYYDLWTKIAWLDGSGSGAGATVIRVSK